MRAAVASGVERMAGILARLSDSKEEAARADALASFSTLVGAVVLARATAGTALSDEILKSARLSLEH